MIIGAQRDLRCYLLCLFYINSMPVVRENSMSRIDAHTVVAKTLRMLPDVGIGRIGP